MQIEQGKKYLYFGAKFGTKVLSQWSSTKLYFIEGSKDLLEKCIIDQNFCG